jgi:asparagine synthase (glutamine-hydrolysing)
MCGIYGSTINYSKDQVLKKLDRTSFRGPDYTGVYSTESINGTPIILGHNRLSIIDLDPRSNQPFEYHHINIVFNGEIYNYLELKGNLKQLGYKFLTTSDTEVICASYLEYGEDCVKHFNGMFAFVIYDAKNHTFFGSRDRLGQKPFYYYHRGLDFEFASQLSSISMHNNRLSISHNSIYKYLNWGYVQDPDSIYNEIKKLPPGHLFTFDLDSGKFNQKKYWDIDFKGNYQYEGTYEHAKQDLNELLHDAVTKRMIADVPLGIFLSGGVDSSLIAAIASKYNQGKVKTFAVKFNEKGFDESDYALKVANHLKTDHVTIECNYNEGIDLIKNFHEYYDEPFADSSAIPSMLLAKHTRKYVTVALSGDAGDESFLGYHRYNWIRIAEKFYNFPSFIRPLITGALKVIPHYRSKVVADVLSSKSMEVAYLKMISSYDISYLDKDFDDSQNEYFKYLFHNRKNIYERASDFDLKTYLNGDINTKVDRASMAFSLEARSPFLDYRVVEFARALPTAFKFNNKNQKRILKDVLYEYVPSEYFNRPKSGFTMPLREWFRKELKEYVLDELSTSGLQLIPGIKVNEVQKMINQHMNGSWNRSGVIWKLLVLKEWLNKNSEGKIIQ